MHRPRLLLRAATLTAVAVLGVACSSGGSADQHRSTPAPSATAAPSLPSSTAPSSTPPSSTSRASHSAPRPSPSHARTTTASAARSASSARASRPLHLPLGFSTGSARQVITVVAPSTGSTRGTLQAWRKVTGGWRKVGAAVPAWLGADGLSRSPSESRSATPIGSFTLTQAFGYDRNPGTALPYLQTTPAEWWISEPGRYYNTHQRCSSHCPFNPGDPNEHLYYERPYYAYAVVIDYNTTNAPGGVRAGAGSAFFLHVTVGQPTAGCVSIVRSELVRLMRWLSPSGSPRILIGVA